MLSEMKINNKKGWAIVVVIGITVWLLAAAITVFETPTTVCYEAK